MNTLRGSECTTHEYMYTVELTQFKQDSIAVATNSNSLSNVTHVAWFRTRFRTDLNKIGLQ